MQRTDERVEILVGKSISEFSALTIKNINNENIYHTFPEICCTVEDLLVMCLQHEIDHVNRKLFTDLTSQV